MAYDVNIDYKQRMNDLRAQMDTTTDAKLKASLQTQYDQAERERLQKIASDLTAYGKHASDSELDRAAGLRAEAQIGTSYDQQREALNQSYAQARQNASNDALSRGMARSSYAQDRLSNLDVERSGALSSLEAARAYALENAKASILDNYRANTANALAQEKKDFRQDIGAYYNDYQAEIDRVQGNNDPSDDWKIPILQAARNEKLLSMQSAATRGGGGGSGGAASFDAMKKQIDAIRALYTEIDGNVLDDWKSHAASYLSGYGGDYADQLAAMYGLSGYSDKTRKSDIGIKNSIYVAGLGDISFEQAEQYEQQGRIHMTGIDANGNPVYSVVMQGH